MEKMEEGRDWREFLELNPELDEASFRAGLRERARSFMEGARRAREARRLEREREARRLRGLVLEAAQARDRKDMLKAELELFEPFAEPRLWEPFPGMDAEGADGERPAPGYIKKLNFNNARAEEEININIKIKFSSSSAGTGSCAPSSSSAAGASSSPGAGASAQEGACASAPSPAPATFQPWPGTGVPIPFPLSWHMPLPADAAFFLKPEPPRVNETSAQEHDSAREEKAGNEGGMKCPCELPPGRGQMRPGRACSEELEKKDCSAEAGGGKGCLDKFPGQARVPRTAELSRGDGACAGERGRGENEGGGEAEAAHEGPLAGENGAEDGSFQAYAVQGRELRFLNCEGGEECVSAEAVALWREAFPRLDMDLELGGIAVWLAGHYADAFKGGPLPGRRAMENYVANCLRQAARREKERPRKKERRRAPLREDKIEELLSLALSGTAGTR